MILKKLYAPYYERGVWHIEEINLNDKLLKPRIYNHTLFYGGLCYNADNIYLSKEDAENYIYKQYHNKPLKKEELQELLK